VGFQSLNNFYAVPPGTGICHQVNLENIAQSVWTSVDQNGETVAYFDTCVGTDSHTTMVNGLGVLGWGVGGIEAEAAMLGQPVSMLIPGGRLQVHRQAAGRRDRHRPRADRHQHAAQAWRGGPFRRILRPGLADLTLADRATLANMAPEYGATCGFFGIDDKTLDYLRLTGREEEQIALVEAYAKEQGFWIDPPSSRSSRARSNSTCRPSCPRWLAPSVRRTAFRFPKWTMCSTPIWPTSTKRPRPAFRSRQGLHHGDGDVTIAAITSCTNTSNPGVLVAAGLVAKKAASLASSPSPGSRPRSPRLAGRHRLPRQGRSDPHLDNGGLQPGGLRLHHLHRQLGPAGRADQQGDQRTASSPRP
jgi:aconitate hydratase